MIQGVIALLIADTTVQGLVGKNKEGDKYKIYPVNCPETEDDPYVILTIIPGTRYTRCAEGPSEQEDVPFDVYIYGKTYKLIDDIYQAIRDRIDNYRGTAGGVKFQNIYIDDQRDGWDKDSGDGLFVRTATYRAMIDVSLGT